MRDSPVSTIVDSPMKCPYYDQCFAERIAHEEDCAQLVLPLLSPMAADLFLEQREALLGKRLPSFGCPPQEDGACAQG
jgi:hypothetical protein